MTRIVPFKNTVICEKVDNEHVDGLIITNTKTAPMYRIVDFSVDDDVNFIFSSGDVVITEGSGDEIEVDGKDIYMFRAENVIAKVCN